MFFLDQYQNYQQNMLINNLENHRIKYSSEKPHKNCMFQRASSLTMIPKAKTKVQQRSKSRQTSRQFVSNKQLSRHALSQCSIKSSRQINTFRLQSEHHSKLSYNFELPTDRIPLQDLQKLSIKKNNRKKCGDIDQSLYGSKASVRENTDRSQTVFQIPQENLSVYESTNFKKKVTEKKLKKFMKVDTQQNSRKSHNQQLSSNASKCPSSRQSIFKQQQKKSTTQSTHYSPFFSDNRISIDQPIILNQQKYIKELKLTEVFFCVKCMRYVFVVEKYYHFPKCQNQIKIDILSEKELTKIGYGRVEMIKQLSEYTETKTQKVLQLYKLVMDNDTDFNHYTSKININWKFTDQNLETRKYLSLQQIDLAFHLIVTQLLHTQLTTRQKDKQNKFRSFVKGRKINFCQGINLDCHNQLNIV